MVYPRLKDKNENPDGLHRRYNVRYANGDHTDPRAIYFVLRLDEFGDDPLHIEACRKAALTWVYNAPPHLAQVAEDLLKLLLKFDDGE